MVPNLVRSADEGKLFRKPAASALVGLYLWPGRPSRSTHFYGMAPEKTFQYSLPLFVYDGDCGLCRRFVRWLGDQDTHGRLQIKPYQALPLPGPLRSRARRTVLFLTADGGKFERGRAILKALAIAGRPAPRFLQWPPCSYLVDLAYTWVAQNRQYVSRWINYHGV